MNGTTTHDVENPPPAGSLESRGANEWDLGFPTSGWTTWQSKVLPVIALGLGPMAAFARLVRGTMLETMQQDYIRTAKAKGLRWRRVVGLHVLRNSLIPVITAAGPTLGFLITGSFVIEQIFAIPGIGRYYVTAVTARDYSVVMGLTVLLANEQENWHQTVRGLLEPQGVQTLSAASSVQPPAKTACVRNARCSSLVRRS